MIVTPHTARSAEAHSQSPTRPLAITHISQLRQLFTQFQRRFSQRRPFGARMHARHSTVGHLRRLDT